MQSPRNRTQVLTITVAIVLLVGLLAGDSAPETVRVRVLRDGAPVEGALVAVARADDWGEVLGAWLDRAAAVRTDRDGWARGLLVPRGAGVVLVRTSALGVTNHARFDPRSAGGSIEVPLGSGRVAGRVEGLVPGTPLRLRLVPRELAGFRGRRITDADGRSLFPGEAAVVLDGDGAFRFDSVPPGLYRIDADGEGYGATVPEWFEVGAGGEVELGIRTVRASATLVGSVRVPLLATRLGSPWAVLLDAADRAVAMTPMHTSRFVFRGIEPGRYRVVVWDDERRLDSPWAHLEPEEEHLLVLGESTPRPGRPGR